MSECQGPLLPCWDALLNVGPILAPPSFRKLLGDLSDSGGNTFLNLSSCLPSQNPSGIEKGLSLYLTGRKLDTTCIL